MGTTRNTGYLQNIVQYDASNNITLPANLTVTGNIVGYATTSYVTTQINNLVNGAPGALDTLNELAAALGNNASFSTTVTNSLAGKQASLSGTGFVKISGTTISYDNSIYLTTASATSTYLPLVGGTLTGALGGTSASFSSNLSLKSSGNSGLIINSSYAPSGKYWSLGVNYNNNDGELVFSPTSTSFGDAKIIFQQNGRVGIGTLNDNGYLLDVNGTGRFSGQLTLSSTITNGTYTYMLPSATGTLALTSAIPTNNNQLTNGAGYLTSVTTITGNAGSATLLKSINTTSSILSNWNPQSLTYQAWGQAWGHSSISADTGDIALWLRPSQYVASGTEVCMIIDGDYYAASGAQKVLHAGNYGSYALPLGGGTLSGTLSFAQPVGLSFANGQYIKDNGGGGLVIYSGAAVNINGTSVTMNTGLTAGSFTTTGDSNFGPDSGGDNGIRIRFGSDGSSYGRIRFMQAGVNTQTIHCFSTNWQGGAFLGASAGAININGTNGVTFGGWNMPDAHISPDALYVKAWATPSSSKGWNGSSVLRLQQGSTGDNVFIEMRNRADAGDYAGILFTDNNIGGYIGFRTYASNNVAAGSDCMIYGTYNDHIFQNGSSESFNGKTETFRIYANGSVRATGAITAYSDRRIKENIITIDNALEKTLQLRGVFYNRTDKDDKSQKIGVIAQEIQEILPQVVSEDYNGLLSVSYGNITGVLIEAIKEQQTQIESQKSEIDELKDLVQQLINR